MNLTSIVTLPATWSKTDKKGEITEVKLREDSTEYNSVKKYLAGSSLRNIEKIVRVQNPYIWSRYQCQKAECKRRYKKTKEVTLLHATDASLIPSIVQDNLDRRFVKRSRFGKGVSFTPDAVYANKYCSGKNSNNRAIVVCKVLVGETHKGWYATKIPETGKDTTVGNNKKVYVKYYDDEFYPEYVVYYTANGIKCNRNDGNKNEDKVNYEKLSAEEYDEEDEESDEEESDHQQEECLEKPVEEKRYDDDDYYYDDYHYNTYYSDYYREPIRYSSSYSYNTRDTSEGNSVQSLLKYAALGVCAWYAIKYLRK